MSLNVVTLMGRLTADPELKKTPSDLSVISFTIAVDRNYSNEDNKRQADFIHCVAWRQTAEFISRYFSKGQMIAVQGALQTRSYLDKQENKRVITEVLCSHVFFAGAKPQEKQDDFGSPPPPPDQYSQDDYTDVPEDEEDLPF